MHNRFLVRVLAGLAAWLIPLLSASSLPVTYARIPRSAPLSSADAGGRWSVRTTGDQGSGILSSMSAANCFIVLAADQGNVDAGATVDVQPLEGLV